MIYGNSQNPCGAEEWPGHAQHPHELCASHANTFPLGAGNCGSSPAKMLLPKRAPLALFSLGRAARALGNPWFPDPCKSTCKTTESLEGRASGRGGHSEKKTAGRRPRGVGASFHPPHLFGGKAPPAPCAGGAGREKIRSGGVRGKIKFLYAPACLGWGGEGGVLLPAGDIYKAGMHPLPCSARGGRCGKHEFERGRVSEAGLHA